MPEEERPVHTEYNCETGETVHTPVTDSEWEAMKQASIQEAAERAQREKEDADLKAAVAAHPDPIVKELARRLGLQ